MVSIPLARWEMAVMIVPAFAADDPLQIVENLSEFIFSYDKPQGPVLPQYPPHLPKHLDEPFQILLGRWL